jgi:hypothetical protein
LEDPLCRFQERAQLLRDFGGGLGEGAKERVMQQIKLMLQDDS